MDTNGQPEFRICFEIQLNRIAIVKYSHLECTLAYCDHVKYAALGKSFSVAYVSLMVTGLPTQDD